MASPRSQKASTSRTRPERPAAANTTGAGASGGDAQPEEPATPKPSGPSPTRKKLDRILTDAAGINHPRAATMMVNQAANTVYRPAGRSAEEEKDASFNTIAQLLAYAPKDVLEGMLVSQMIGTHNAAMECLRRAQLPEQTPEGRELNLKHGGKLMALFTRQAEALDKHRNRGQQKITVEHVTVNAGGQAVMANIQVGDAARCATAMPASPLALANDPGELAPSIDAIPSRVAEAVEVGSAGDDDR